MPSKTMRIPVNPLMLRWARERAGQELSALEKAFPDLAAWERGDVQPTLKQLERFAQKTHVPFGYLFLDSPPNEPLPIPDFRTMPGVSRRPSPNLLDTIYICQQRQEWYRNYLQTLGAEALSFVGSVTLEAEPTEVATDIRQRLQFDLEERRKMRTWEEALRRFIDQAEAAGVLVMSSGIVGSNTHRKLDPQEFRGFALVDNLAPVVFINAADTKAAQIFTLAHELAHVWLGESGVSDVQIASFPDERVETWCNQVAAELLVPVAALEQVHEPGEDLRPELDRLAHYFKVSTLVILRRLHEIGAFSREEFWQAYQDEVEHLRQFERRGAGGGDFYRTLNTRVSKSFAQAVVISTLEGQTLFRDAYQMLGIRKPETFRKFAQALGVA
ncbi:MAG: ImmA/IrrE family metallo-endopeptidase [Candidatus Promineifilaceae bacterium]